MSKSKLQQKLKYPVSYAKPPTNCSVQILLLQFYHRISITKNFLLYGLSAVPFHAIVSCRKYMVYCTSMRLAMKRCSPFPLGLSAFFSKSKYSIAARSPASVGFALNIQPYYTPTLCACVKTECFNIYSSPEFVYHKQVLRKTLATDFMYFSRCLFKRDFLVCLESLKRMKYGRFTHDLD